MERLAELYRKTTGQEPESLEILPLSGSARKYFRLTGPRTMVGVIGTNIRENNAFVTIARKMRSKGLNVPEVYGVSGDGMIYLQEDLGETQLFEMLRPSIESGIYTEEHLDLVRKTVAALPALQFRTAEDFDFSICFPDSAFNARMLLFDLNYFKYDFLKFTALEFDEIRLQDDFDALSAAALSEEGREFMYRDFQARNVMIRDSEPWFIDFQGGRRGPVQYDLASFVWNAGTHFPAAFKAELEDVYLESLKEFRRVDKAAFHERYRTIALVRILQELGAFGFRGIFERKQVFLDSIPPARKGLAEFIADGLPAYPCLEDILRRLAYEWEPRF